MAIITKIEEQKNKKRVNIFVDNAFFCGLTKETAIIFKLKVGSEVNQKQLEEAIFASEVNRAFEKASDYIGSRMHTKKELYDKLLKKGFEKSVADKAVKKLEEYHYVDDALFARQYVGVYKKYSKKMLMCKLLEKGVSKDIIEEALVTREDEDELEACKKHAKAYIKGKDVSDKESVQKLFASLARRGYSFDIIKKATKSVLCEDCEDEFPENYD